MKLRALILTAALAGSVAFASPATDSGTADTGTGTDNFTLVENIPHSAGGRGSDIEFATFTYADIEAVEAAGYQQPEADADPATDGIQKTIALAGTTGRQLYLYDITDPENTYETASYACPANQGDTQVFTRVEEDGRVRTFTTYTVEDGGSAVNATVQCAVDAGLVANQGTEGGRYTGTFIIEITDPFAPTAVSFIEVPEGSHNGTVHPSGNYFYNSNSSLITEQAGVVPGAPGDGEPGIEYYDITDIEAPDRLGKLILPIVPASLGTESHDITFNADGTRAYSAALSQGVIIDTENPANPQILSNWADPTIQVWHQADPIQIGDRTLLVVEDEVAGATGTGQCPNGGVHVFDVTDDPIVPTKLGYWNIDEARVMAADGSASSTYSCTAHVFRLYPEAGVMTISYYNGGVRVVDLGGLIGIGVGGTGVLGNPVEGTDPMVQLGFRRFPDSNSWAAKAPAIAVDEDGELLDFYVFSNGSRGLDVLKFAAGDAAAEAEAAGLGRWYSAQQAAAVLPSNLSRAQIQAGLPTYSCLLTSQT